MSANPHYATISRTGWLWKLAAAGLVGGLLLVASSCSFGFVKGEEFNPQRFERRTFYYFELPLVQWQVWPTVRQAVKCDLCQHVQSLLGQAEPQPQDRWDLVLGERGLYRVAGPALTLIAYLDAGADGGPVKGTKLRWLKWSQDNPQLAGLLWDEVSWLARRELYELVPLVMDLGKSASDPERFRRQLESRIGAALQDALEREQGASQPRLDQLTSALDDRQAARPAD